jgi:hypothetical protein
MRTSLSLFGPAKSFFKCTAWVAVLPPGQWELLISGTTLSAAFSVVPRHHFLSTNVRVPLALVVFRTASYRPGRPSRDPAKPHLRHDKRVDTLLQHLQRSGSEKLAPARRWPEWRAGLMQLDFFSGNGLLLRSKSQFRQIAGHGFWNTMEGAGLLARVWMRKLRS